MQTWDHCSLAGCAAPKANFRAPDEDKPAAHRNLDGKNSKPVSLEGCRRIPGGEAARPI
jgi:hypothetical protein